MNKTVILVGLLAATATLGACGKVTSPPRKPGYWEVSSVNDNRPSPAVVKYCFDEASDRRSPVLPAARRGCTPKIAQTSDGFTADATCTFGPASITSHSVYSGDFQSKYTVVSTRTVTGAPNPAMNGQHTSTTTWTYQGADCPSELSPGQMELPNGTVRDIGAAGGPGGGGGGGGGGNAMGGNSMGGGNSTAGASNATNAASNATH